MRHVLLRSWFIAWALACAAVTSAQAAAPAQLRAQPLMEALARAHAAVVGVQVQATEGARSAQTLGALRSGSGVVIGADGLVLTIGYLILEAEHIQLVTQEGKTVPARAVAYDTATGFGLVRPLFPLRGVQAARLATAGSARAGQSMIAATGGTDGEVILTQLVSRRPFTAYWEYHIDGALFTSPPIADHSGAPLFNARGELLGIGSLFVSDALGDQQHRPGNMFVPVELLKPILAELQRTGTTQASRRPWLGLSSAQQPGGVQIVRVTADSPAQEAGLQPGDVVLAVAGTPVTTLEAFYKRVWAQQDPEQDIELTVQQGEETRRVTVHPVDRMRTLKQPPGI